VATPPGIEGYIFAGVYDGHGGARTAQYLEEHMFEFLKDGRAPEVDTRVVTGSTRPVMVIRDLFQPGRNRGGYGEPSPVAGRLRAALASGEDDDIRESLEQCFTQLDERIIKFLRSCDDASVRESGSTATVALCNGQRLIVANVGDSRAVLSRRGEPITLSSEHRVYGDGPMVQYEVQRIKAGGGWVDGERVCGILGVSRAFGDIEFKGQGLNEFLRAGVEYEMFSEEFAR
jgi:serine/threonine protein phosphatase PrpC